MTGAVIASTGVILFGRGVAFAAVGGSWYFVFAGMGLTVAGLGLATGRVWTRGWYALFLFVALQWAFAEVGLSSRLLETRMIVEMIAGGVLLLPGVGRDLRSSPDAAASLVACTERAMLWHEAAPAALAAGLLLRAPRYARSRTRCNERAACWPLLFAWPAGDPLECLAPLMQANLLARQHDRHRHVVLDVEAHGVAFAL
jgi:hypothetical protein